MSTTLLLLDLDGVMVAGRTEGGEERVHCLHPGAADHLAGMGTPYAVLTHRSRPEAEQILAALGLDGPAFVGGFCANDIFRGAVRAWSWRNLLTGGLRKSHALALIAEASGVPPERMAFIDDVPGNVADMAERGVGLTMLAPIGLPGDGTVRSFELTEALDRYLEWAAGDPSRVGLRLTPVTRRLGAPAVPDGHVIRPATGAFTTLRAAGRSWRRLPAVRRVLG